MKYFSTGGDWGDSIASFAVVPAIGGGKINFVPQSNRREPYTALKVEKILPLLERQPWCQGISFGPVHGIDLDRWRREPTCDNIADQVADCHGVDRACKDVPWLHCNEPLAVAPVVISRSPRYHGGRKVWRRIMEKYRDKVFLGLQEEHANFQANFGLIPWYETKDWWTVARIMAGAQICCHNQSSLFWVSAALGKQKVVLETWPQCRNCHFDRYVNCRCLGTCKCPLP